MTPLGNPTHLLCMHQQSDYSVADEDDLIIDKPLDADNEPITHHLPTQTIECLTNEQSFKCKLLKILNDVNAPHYLFQLIMECALEAARLGYAFQSQSTRNAHIQYLKSWLNLPNLSLGQQIPT